MVGNEGIEPNRLPLILFFDKGFTDPQLEHLPKHSPQRIRESLGVFKRL